LKQRSDSLYKPVQRKKRVFHKLTVPRELKKDLPYKTKMKNQQKQIAGVNKATRVPVLREEKDKKASRNLNLQN
jgi:ribosome biogenesis protein BMS1